MLPDAMTEGMRKREGAIGNGKDPFAPENRIPLPSCREFPYVESTVSSTSMRRRNARERQRVRSVNEAFLRLKKVLPFPSDSTHRVSKLEIVRLALDYIQQLECILHFLHTQSTQY